MLSAIFGRAIQILPLSFMLKTTLKNKILSTSFNYYLITSFIDRETHHQFMEAEHQTEYEHQQTKRHETYHL